MLRYSPIILLTLALFLTLNTYAFASAPETLSDVSSSEFPRSLDSYHDADFESISEIIKHRIDLEPFNLVAAIIFILAIIHTFMAQVDQSKS